MFLIDIHRVNVNTLGSNHLIFICGQRSFQFLDIFTRNLQDCRQRTFQVLDIFAQNLEDCRQGKFQVLDILFRKSARLTFFGPLVQPCPITTIQICEPLVQSSPITTKVGDSLLWIVVLIQLYMWIKFVTDLQMIGSFLRICQFPPLLKLSVMHYC